MDGDPAVTWFTLGRHDITDKPVTTVGLDDSQTLQLLTALETKLRSEQADVDKWDRHYRGTQPLEFLHPDVVLMVGERLKNLLVNFPRLALNSLEERLDVEGFRIAGESQPNRDLWRIWQANDFDLASGRTHLRALRHGRSFVSAWEGSDPATPRLRVESAKTMTVDFEPGTDAVIRAALKSWQDGQTTYATLYLPDRIVKYWRGGDAPKARRGESAWQVRGEPVDNPLGVVPIVPFLNAYDDDQPSGESEMTDVVHLANAINKLATDMMVTSEFHAMPRRWATGIEIPKGPEGRRLEAEAKAYWENATAGKVWLAGAGVQYGQFPAADLKNFVDAITMLATQLAALAGLPPHYVGITHDNPASADAIRSAEASLVKRALRKQRTFGEAWEDVMTLALWVRDGSIPAGAESMETVWRSAETPTRAQTADAAVKLHQAGIITDEQAQEDVGYSPEQRKLMREARVAAVTEQATAEMRARVQQALDLIGTYGIDSKIAFAAVGLILPPKAVAAGPEAPPPPEGDPIGVAPDASKGALAE